MDPRLELALRHFNLINLNPRKWAALGADNLNTSTPTITLDIGVIHSNGFKEKRQVTRYYFLTFNGKEAYYKDVAHV